MITTLLYRNTMLVGHHRFFGKYLASQINITQLIEAAATNTTIFVYASSPFPPRQSRTTRWWSSAVDDDKFSYVAVLQLDDYVNVVLSLFNKWLLAARWRNLAEKKGQIERRVSTSIETNSRFSTPPPPKSWERRDQRDPYFYFPLLYHAVF